MNNIRWVIQDNLIAEKDLANMHTILDELGIEHEEVLVIPFSNELPKFTLDDKTNIYYGSTTFMNNIYHQLEKPEGLFYNHETFSMENYIKEYGDLMLNELADILSIEEAIAKYGDSEKDWFFRPDGDGKEFEGQVMTGVEMCGVLKRAVLNDERLNSDHKMLVSQPWNIRKEWRNYIVNGKVVTSTRYREDFRLSKSGTDIPKDMLEFVKHACKVYQPHKVFAMDIALCGGEYYIIECGCMNSVGFYHCDVNEYVKRISEYVDAAQVIKAAPPMSGKETRVMRGGELLECGHTIDGSGRPIYKSARYHIEFNHDNQSLVVMTEEDKYLKSKHLQFAALKMFGGIIGLNEQVVKSGTVIEDKIILWEYNFLMRFFADREDFEKSQYIQEQLEIFKKSLAEPK